LNRELHDLNKKIERKKPKKKFNLIRKAAAEPKIDATKKILHAERKEIEIKKLATVESKRGETIHIRTKGEDDEIVLRDLIGCKVTVEGDCSSLTVEGAQDSELVLNGCIFGAAMIRKCCSCSVVLCSRQLRIQNCSSTTFRIAVCSAVALEDSSELKFGTHPELESRARAMASKQMKILDRSHVAINDFEWPDRTAPSPNWCEV